MGHGASKDSSHSSEGRVSRRARFKERLRQLSLHRSCKRGGNSSASSIYRILSAENFAGIALLTLIRVCA